MASYDDEVGVEEVVEAPLDGSSTLDFFLSGDPEAVLTKDVEVKRLGLVFTLSSITDEAIQTCMKRSEKRQSKSEKQRGIPPERDMSRMENLIIVESCTAIKKILSDGEYAEPVTLTDEALLAKWGPRPEDVVNKWLLSGEKSQLADMITDLAGYEANSVVEAGN